MLILLLRFLDWVYSFAVRSVVYEMSDAPPVNTASIPGVQ